MESADTRPAHGETQTRSTPGVRTVTETTTSGEGTSSADGSAAVQWAPAPPARKRWVLRIGIPAAVAAVGVVAASLVLIAPGTAVAGVPVGFLTAGAATDAISQRLATTTITLGEGGPTVTGADLGATVDANSLGGSAYEQHPLWNVTQWFGESADAEITLDAATAGAALQRALPDLFTAPTDATLVFEGSTYRVNPAVVGEGLDIDAVRTALQSAFAEGQSTAVFEPVIMPVEAAATTEAAEAAAERLNTMLGEIGFYVGDERTVPISPKTAASWLTIADDFTITADVALIQAAVDDLTEAIDQDVADGTVVTNASGDVLRTIDEGRDGRVLGDTSGVAEAFATQLAAGDAVYVLPVAVTPQKTTELARLLEVDLSEQRLYLKENGTVVDTWLISSGRPGAVTFTGNYSIGWKTSAQDMKGTARDSGKEYTQKDVPWVMYFNGNQAFHGAYWHNNFGNVMSAGCVNMPPAKAKTIYDWSPEGTDVWIHR